MSFGKFLLPLAATVTADSLPPGKGVFDPRLRPQDTTYARQLVSAGLALLTAVALPAGDQDTQLPARPLDPVHARNWTPTNDLARATAVTLPKQITEWPLAKRALPPAPESPPINVAVINTVVVVTTPFAEFDWPLAVRVDSPLARDRQRVNDLARQTALTLPEQVTEWPLPARIDSPVARNWDRVNDLSRQTAVTLPFDVTEWPLPQRVDSPLARKWERANDLGRQTAVTLPEQVTEWPLPLPRPPLVNTPWPVNQLPVNIGSPFAQRDWPLAKRVDSPIARDRQRVNDLGRQTAVTLPKQTTEWPLPVRRALRAFDGPLPNVAALNTVVVVTKPFAALGWFVPAARKSVSRDGALADSLALTTPVVRPFATLGWTVPLSVDSAAARDWAPPSVTPPTPTPIPEASSGARRLVMTVRQAWSREKFREEVEAAHGRAVAAVDFTGVDKAPKKVQEALRESIIQMIARLPQIVAAFAAGYKIEDIRQVVAAMRRAKPMMVQPGGPLTEPGSLLDDIVEAEQYVSSRFGALEASMRVSQSTLDRAQADQDRLARLSDQTVAKVRELSSGMPDERKAVEAARQAALAEARQVFERRRAEAEAARREAERIAKLRAEIVAMIHRARVAYQQALADEARLKFEVARAHMAAARQMLVAAEDDLAQLEPSTDDDEEAVTLLGGS